MSLHELLAALEDDEPERADVYMIPPEDGILTDADSDKSDDEHEAAPTASSEGSPVRLGLSQQVLGPHRHPQSHVWFQSNRKPSPQSRAGRRQDPHSSHTTGEKPSKRAVSDRADNFGV